VLSEQQRAFATLVGLGQYQHKQIAQMLNIHRNSVRNWLRDERIQTLVYEVQESMQNKLESMALESVSRKNALLLGKATRKLEEMLEGRSEKKQLAALRLLLEYGALDDVIHKKQDDPHGEQPSPIRLDPQLRAHMKVTQS
jgi:hypothetical protein